MVERTEYVAGTPNWVDLGSPDIDASAAFYGSLFGWVYESSGPVEETGGYGMFRLGGKLVAGLGPAQNPGPPVWATYITVDDADKTVEVVKANGGAVFLEPMDVLDAGRMAVFADPQGAVLSIWQPRLHKGAQVVNEPGTFSWTELNTSDTAAAEEFYATVFGWTAKRDDNMDYTELEVDGQSVAGMMTLPAEAAAHGVPPHWLVYFTVESTDDALAKAEGLGATRVTDAMDIPGVGRFAIVSDPQGAVFSLFQAAAG